MADISPWTPITSAPLPQFAIVRRAGRGLRFLERYVKCVAVAVSLVVSDSTYSADKMSLERKVASALQRFS